MKTWGIPRSLKTPPDGKTPIYPTATMRSGHQTAVTPPGVIRQRPKARGRVLSRSECSQTGRVLWRGCGRPDRAARTRPREIMVAARSGTAWMISVYRCRPDFLGNARLRLHRGLSRSMLWRPRAGRCLNLGLDALRPDPEPCHPGSAAAGPGCRFRDYVAGSCIGPAAASPQHFLYFRSDPHQHGWLRPGGHAITLPSVMRWAA
jgi:hypothetical protein